ncbi:MAG: histidine--tRNA ligase [Proteobacteria bacterium]|nr:histidine--tRNA ligase [Pseudomonadota bacterium]
MSRISTKPPSGTRDFLPADLARRRFVVRVIEEVFGSYGFVALETPAIENLSTLLGKYGQEGDQLLYRLLHRRDALTRALATAGVGEAELADQGLRYDLTVPLARVVAEYRELPRFFKRYQIQPVWRADRPGRGRFREFYQCDVDIVGADSLLAEAEVCAATAQVLGALGFKDFVLQLNHRQLLRALVSAAGIDAAQEGTALVAVDKLDKVGQAGVQQELTARGIGPQAADRLLELLTRDPAAGDRASIDWLRAELGPTPAAALALPALDQLAALLELLAATPAAAHVRLNPALARGLSYYTGPIFELTLPGLAGSVGGGGRYDNLIGMFGSQPIPAVGCSLGLERILLLLEERGLYPTLTTGPDLLLCWFGVELDAVLRTAHALRAQTLGGRGLRVEVYPQAAKLAKQLQYATAPHATAPHATAPHATAPGVGLPAVAILGASEASAGTITLKHLASGQQRTVPLAEASETLQGLALTPPALTPAGS